MNPLISQFNLLELNYNYLLEYILIEFFIPGLSRTNGPPAPPLPNGGGAMIPAPPPMPVTHIIILIYCFRQLSINLNIKYVRLFRFREWPVRQGLPRCPEWVAPRRLQCLYVLILLLTHKKILIQMLFSKTGYSRSSDVPHAKRTRRTS